MSRRSTLIDAALGVALLGLMLVAAATDDPDHAGRALGRDDLVAALVALVFIALRRRWPLYVFLASAAATAAAAASDTGLPPLAAASLICGYTMATRTDRTAAWFVGAGGAIGVYLGVVLAGGELWRQPEAISTFAWSGLAIALGDVMRTRRAYQAALLDREARRRVVEERVRIARELHDVVAHNIAMINVQAGVAAHVLDRSPDQAKESLAHIRQAGRTVLEELSTVLGVLRANDDLWVGPTPGLDRLPRLLDQLTNSGLRVEHRQAGEARELPVAVDLAAYRIVQESLTNAQKHGDGQPVRLSVSFDDRGVTLTIENSAGAGTTTDGYGLIGMRERAIAVGGTLSADRTPHGTFAVRAFLPAGVR
ncbi:sensor histidine kinase [Cryptosporangium sp. NPDC048952]|uniref:sensor histidine kinase n=1 Tax=Cryptosporangium sp. NPDC048952 TaxID=3363961 RepID=UPI0037196623